MKIRVCLSGDNFVEHDDVSSFLPDEHGNLKVFNAGDLVAVHADCSWVYASTVVEVDAGQLELPVQP